ncbi:hypothetical protein ACJX0J_019406, partial [Zea mays]
KASGKKNSDQDPQISTMEFMLFILNKEKKVFIHDYWNKEIFYKIGSIQRQKYKPLQIYIRLHREVQLLMKVMSPLASLPSPCFVILIT